MGIWISHKGKEFQPIEKEMKKDKKFQKLMKDIKSKMKEGENYGTIDMLPHNSKLVIGKHGKIKWVKNK